MIGSRGAPVGRPGGSPLRPGAPFDDLRAVATEQTNPFVAVGVVASTRHNAPPEVGGPESKPLRSQNDEGWQNQHPIQRRIDCFLEENGRLWPKRVCVPVAQRFFKPRLGACGANNGVNKARLLVCWRASCQLNVLLVSVLPTTVVYAPKVLFSSETIFFRLPLNSVYCLSAASAGGKIPIPNNLISGTDRAGL